MNKAKKKQIIEKQNVKSLKNYKRPNKIINERQ